MGSGSDAFFAPGEHERYQGWLGEFYPRQQPRVFFAGEHLGINHASVQGAIQTAVSAVAASLLSSSLLTVRAMATGINDQSCFTSAS